MYQLFYFELVLSSPLLLGIICIASTCGRLLSHLSIYMVIRFIRICSQRIHKISPKGHAWAHACMRPSVVLALATDTSQRLLLLANRLFVHKDFGSTPKIVAYCLQAEDVLHVFNLG